MKHFFCNGVYNYVLTYFEECVLKASLVSKGAFFMAKTSV